MTDYRFGMDVSVRGECRVLTLKGQISDADAEVFQEAMKREIKTEAACLIVDLGQLLYLCSSGLSVLVWAHDALTKRGRRLVLVSVNSRTRRLLALTNLDEAIETAGSVEEALGG
jgi:anti-anti-sigma factor